MNYRKRVPALLRYIVAGSTVFLVNLGLYAFLLYQVHVWYISASIIAFCLTTAYGFAVQKLFAFRDYSRGQLAGQFSAYGALVLFNLCANALILFVLVQYGGLDKVTGLILTSILIALWNFFVYEKIIFPHKALLGSPLDSSEMGVAQRPTISIVIPCYNEEQAIKLVLDAIPPEIDETIVVDNNCTDRTAPIARACGAQVVEEHVPGYGAALKRGFAAATGDIIVTLDGDNQHPVHEVLHMVDYLIAHALDFVSGSRFPLKDPSSMSTAGKIGNWGLTSALNLLFGLALYDSQSGMWVFRRRVLDRVSLVNNDMAFSQELKIKVATLPGIRFAEYHIPVSRRIGTAKLMPLRHGVLNLLDLFLIRLGIK